MKLNWIELDLRFIHVFILLKMIKNMFLLKSMLAQKWGGIIWRGLFMASIFMPGVIWRFFEKTAIFIPAIKLLAIIITAIKSPGKVVYINF
jgi:hypothetical protein